MLGTHTQHARSLASTRALTQEESKARGLEAFVLEMPFDELALIKENLAVVVRGAGGAVDASVHTVVACENCCADPLSLGRAMGRAAVSCACVAMRSGR